jgi:thiol-disulfide isomerase/thioredoxin
MNILFSILILTLAIPFGAKAAEGEGPEIGQLAPNIVGRTLEDRPYRLRVDTEKPKVINFFWVSCIPCKEEMPELAQLEKKYPNFKFISVHTKKESAQNVANFIKSLSGAPSNIVLTSGGMQEAFNYMGLPHTIVLDSDNVVQMNFIGYTADNIKQLDKVLQQK